MNTNKLKLNMIEGLLTLLIAIITIYFQPSLPLLTIPFLIIIGMRSIFSTLEDSGN